MRKVDIDEARTHLSELIERAARGEAFVIPKAGKPLVKVVPFDMTEKTVQRRLGFLAGEIAAPDDFDRMGQEEVARRSGAGASSRMDTKGTSMVPMSIRRRGRDHHHAQEHPG